MKKVLIISVVFLLTALAYTASYSSNNEVEPGFYKHFRGGNYKVVGTARFSEDPHKEFVIYQQLYESTLMPEGGALPVGTLWARPKEMFVELVENKQGQLVPRFQKVVEYVGNEEL